MEKWTICNKTGDFSGIRDEFGVSAVMARLLVNRGLKDSREIRSYLYPTIEDLNSPHLMLNLDGAVALIMEKIKENSRIRIVGDYDVDGIMATYILYDALKIAGACVDWYIPHRIRDGYGINADIVRRAYEDGVDTVITCDNGIAAVEAAFKAKELGITMVITDHHEIPGILPEAEFIVDPKQEADAYPGRDICGAVVAAKFAQALFEACGLQPGIERYLEFMAMATVCDVVPLQGENRVIAKLGMERLKTTSNCGLAALMKETAINPETLSEYHLGYVLGPCFNATGRIDDASLAFDLLCAPNEQEASRYAADCRLLNDDRKRITTEQEQRAFAILDEMGDRLPKVIVLDMPDCHESILGIIAGRIKERYNRPAIAVTKNGEHYKGSARSIPAYNIYEELSKCSDYLVKFGGHPMAAGLTIYGDRLEEFTEAINGLCTLTDDDMAAKILLDAEVSFNLFTEDVLEEIKLLAPFGQNNPSPVFAERNVRVKSVRYMGKENNFLRFRLLNSFGHEINAVSFLDANETLAQLTEKFGESEVRRAFAGGENSIALTLAYVPRINEYRDIREIQLNIKSLRS